MTFGSMTPQDVRLVNAVFVAAIEQADGQGIHISLSALCKRLQPLVQSGERDFDTLLRAALGDDALTKCPQLSFYGTMEGWFKAIDATSGRELWKFKTGSGIIGQPTTWAAPNGKQYVAVLSGVGGWAGAIVSGPLDGRDGTAALGFANAMRDLPEHTTAGGMLYVFALP